MFIYRVAGPGIQIRVCSDDSTKNGKPARGCRSLSFSYVFFLWSRLHFILHIQKSLKQAEFNRVNKVVSTGQQRAQNVVGKTKGS